MAPSGKQQVIDLLKSLETKDPVPFAYVNPNQSGASLCFVICPSAKGTGRNNHAPSEKSGVDGVCSRTEKGVRGRGDEDDPQLYGIGAAKVR